MFIQLIGILLAVLFGVLGLVFIFVSITDLRERWARNLFLCGIVQLLVVAVYCFA